jgi:predicted  nucleic acid-binding Zn-ribbon protein
MVKNMINLKKTVSLVLVFAGLGVPLSQASDQVVVDQIDLESPITTKPYAITIDVLRLVCIKISQDEQLKLASKELIVGLSESNCNELLKDQSNLVKSDPKFLQNVIVAELATNLDTMDYNLTMLELSRVFENAPTTVFPIKPELVWSTLEELLYEVHEQNWRQTGELRLDRESRVGTVGGTAFRFANITAGGIFVSRLGRGFLQGIRGTRYLSASMSGMAQRTGERVRYFLNKKHGWEKPVFERSQFEYQGVKYDYHFKTSGGDSRVTIARTVQRTDETKTLSELQKKVSELQENAAWQRDNLAKLKSESHDAVKAEIANVEGSIAFYEQRVLVYKRAIRHLKDSRPVSKHTIDGVEYQYRVNGRGDNASVTISRDGNSSGGRVTSETVYDTKSFAEIRAKTEELRYQMMNDNLARANLNQESLKIGSDLTTIKSQISKLDVAIAETKKLLETYEIALTTGRGVVPNHLKEFVFRREVLGSSQDDLLALAAERKATLSSADLDFLSRVKPRSYFDRLLSKEEVSGSVGAKLRRYFLGREAITIYIGAGLGAYMGSKYHAKLYERDITRFRDSALQVLGNSYESALASVEANVSSDLKISENLIETLTLAKQTQDSTPLRELALSESLDGKSAALEYWASESQALIDSQDSFKATVAWLAQNYKAPTRDRSDTSKPDETLAGIFFNPERVLGLHDQLIRNSQMIVALSLELSMLPE